MLVPSRFLTRGSARFNEQYPNLRWSFPRSSRFFAAEPHTFPSEPSFVPVSNRDYQAWREQGFSQKEPLECRVSANFPTPTHVFRLHAGSRPSSQAMIVVSDAAGSLETKAWQITGTLRQNLLENRCSRCNRRSLLCQRRL